MKNIFIQTLLNLPKIGRKTAERIISSGSGEIIELSDLLDLVKENRETNKRIPEFNITQFEMAYSKSEKLFTECNNANIHIISEFDTTYPKKFQSMTDKPLLIYVMGNLEALNSDYSIAVIGTREPSSFGIRACEKLTAYFVKNQFTIVSGLALGCDSAAHKATLKNNGITIAVMPCGLDKVYPSSNSELYRDILDNNGTVISEYPLYTKPQRNFFVERDRLQSGLSDAICIIETGVKGGTMHTYSFAKKQNRLISALKHPKDKLSEKSMGNRKIIEDKTAHPLGSSEEIYSFIDLIKGNSKVIPIKKEEPDQNQDSKDIQGTIWDKL